MVQNNSWGSNYPLADYPVREKKPVPVFNIKAYVDKKKEEKINKMLGEFNNTGGNSGGGQTFPSNPFGPTPNPFGGNQTPFPGASGPNPFGSTPFGGQPSMFNSPTPNTDNFNVDELVKRIDAKIAELEEEERKEKEKLNSQQTSDVKTPVDISTNVDNPVEKIDVLPVIEQKPVENIPSEPIIESIPQEKITEKTENTNIPVENEMPIDIPQSKIEKHVEKIEPRDNNYVTDDQFFDDFFSDDE